MKNYRERLEKYQKHELSEIEAEAFEKELHDASALFDYLMEHEELENFQPSNDSTTFFKEDKQMKRKIRKRLYRMIALITVVVLLIVGGSSYVLPKILDAYYYNPLENQKMAENNSSSELQPSHFELYQRVYHQVTLDKDRFVENSITKIGPAKYQIHQINFNDFRGTHSVYTYIMDKGEVDTTAVPTNNNTSLIYNHSGSYPEYSIYDDEKSDTNTSKLKSKIDSLPESSWLKLCLSFQKSLTWQELQQFISEHPEVIFYTATLKDSYNLGVRLDYEDNYQGALGGFVTQRYASKFVEKLEKKYPRLISLTGALPPSTTDEEVKEFLISNFTYLLKHPEDNLEKMMNGSSSLVEDEQQNYQNALTTLKNDELEFSHIEVAIPKSVYSTFVTTENFYYVTLEDLSLFSMYQTD